MVYFGILSLILSFSVVRLLHFCCCCCCIIIHIPGLAPADIEAVSKRINTKIDACAEKTVLLKLVLLL